MIAAPDDLAEAVARLAAGTGPVAVDAERASGYRYGQRAYLVQLRRAGRRDRAHRPDRLPGPVRRSTPRSATSRRCCTPRRRTCPAWPRSATGRGWLFDTELAGRLLGYPRVALGTMLEEVLGFRLAKEHSAADWSVRPLPAEMLKYAALDVEVLTELRDALAEQLAEQGKTEWARQEFAAIAAAPPAAAPGRPVAAHLGHPQGADQARRSPSSASCGRRGTRSPGTPTCRRAGC